MFVQAEQHDDAVAIAKEAVESVKAVLGYQPA